MARVAWTSATWTCRSRSAPRLTSGRAARIRSASAKCSPPRPGIVSATVTTETHITYRGDLGDPPLVGVLVQMLEEEGVQVRWQPPERREVRGMAEAVVVDLVADGALTGIKAAVLKFRGQFWRARVDVEGEDDDAPPRGGRHRA